MLSPSLLFACLAGAALLACQGAAGLTVFRPDGDLSLSEPFVPSKGGGPEVEGFSFAVEFACPTAFVGTVVSKPGVFELSVSGEPDDRLYSFRLFGRREGSSEVVPAELTVDAETSPTGVVRVAGVCTAYDEPAQSSVGCRLSLYVDGALAGSVNSERFEPRRDVCEPLAVPAGRMVGSVAVAARALSPDELFPEASQTDGRFGTDAHGRWLDLLHRRARRNLVDFRDVRFLETPEFVLAVAGKRSTGNPILGVWNRRADCALVTDDGLAWTVEYAGAKGEVRRLRSDSRKLTSTVAFREGGFDVTSVGGGFSVVHGVSLSGGRIARELSVEDRLGSRIRGTEFPVVTLARLPGRDTLLEPQFSGVCYENPTHGHRCDGVRYPSGRVTLQMAGYYDDRGNGVYFAAEDPLALVKDYASDGGNGRLMLKFATSAARASGEAGVRTFAPSGKGVLELYRGGWYELGRVYRRFLESGVPWYDRTIPRTDTPSWFMRNPLWLAGPNLRKRRCPGVRYLADYFDVPLSFAIWAIRPPDPKGTGRFGPVYEMRPDVMASVRELQKRGLHFVTYTNPRLWYSGPNADRFNGYRSSGRLWAVRDERGQAHVSRFCNENYVIPCMGDDRWLDYLCKRTHRVAEAGVDGIYHDQMPCSVPFVCHEPSHGHKVGDPAVWIPGGAWRFCDFLKGSLRDEFPNLVHTGEDASEPYVNRLDGFLPWRFGRPGHVPLFQSLYSPRIQFYARGCDVHAYPGSYEGFFPKYAEQLCFGEQIGWIRCEAMTYPSPQRGYLKKLAHCRRAMADFLYSAEMDRPLTFAKPVGRFASAWGVDGPNVVSVEKTLSSVWRHTDGRAVALFLNVTDEPQEVEPLWERPGQSFAVCREASDVPEVCRGAPRRVGLAPYGFEFWVADDASGDFSRSLAKTLCRSARFWKEDRGGMLAGDPAAFARTGTADARDGRAVTAARAVWTILATIPPDPHLDYSTRVPELKDGWIAALDGGLVNYGTVDFGSGAKAMEMTLATDEPDVTVEFLDVTGDGPVRRIAAFRPAAGAWHDYRTCVSPLYGTVTGRRAVICRVTGGICNLRNWRLLEEGEPAAEQPLERECHGPVDFTAATWTLFGHRTEGCLSLADGGVAFCGEVDFGKAAREIELTVRAADSSAVVDVLDVSDFAPSVPLARFRAKVGTMREKLAFPVEGRRHIVLRVRGGSCVLKEPIAAQR